jgi:hypothetical protein
MNAAVSKLIETSRAHLMGVEVDLKRLRELAEKATPGPWEYRDVDGSAAVCHPSGWVEAILPGNARENADAAFCAAANPAAIIAMADELEVLRKDAERYRHIREIEARGFPTPEEYDARVDAAMVAPEVSGSDYHGLMGKGGV